MDAHKRMIVSDIIAKENWQFVVPIYQREYKWTREEATRLVKDIIACGKGSNEHFVGSIVYQLDKNPNLSDLKLYLVDGQQRLTTFLLITKAVNMLAEDLDDEEARYVVSKTNKMLYIDVDDKSRGYKILPGKKDMATFNAIISAKNFSEVKNNPIVSKSGNMYNNFIAIYDLLKSEVEAGTSLKEVIYNGGFLKISVVEIQLTYDENAQEIFESINSLGVDLNNAELIRNYLLMSNTNQKYLFEKYWEPIQDELIGEPNMEIFVRDYLLLKLEYPINDKDIYKEYVKYSERFIVDGQVDRDAMLQELFEAAQIYEPFLKKSDRYSSETCKLMQELRDMSQSTAYPFLMRVFLDHKNSPEIVTEDILNKTINLIIVYLVRRIVCGVPSHSLRGFMITLYRRIFKVSENYSKYYASIYAFLKNVRSTDYLRSEEEVNRSLITAPIYKNTKFATYLLYRLENGRYPNAFSETVSASSTTVEHIIPQTLTDEWEQMIANEEHSAEEIHRTYLDTLGNLSLSSREKNSVMSNESFERKLEVLRNEGSKFNVLNKDIVTLTEFTEKELLAREHRLSNLLGQRYKLDDVNISGIKFESTIEVIGTEEANDIFNGSTPVSYKLMGYEKTVDSFARLIAELCRQLYAYNPEKMRELADIGFNPWTGTGGVRKCIHHSDEAIKEPLVGEDIYVYTTFNSNYSVQFCVLVMKEFGIEADQLVVFLKKDTVKKENTIIRSKRVAMVRDALTQLAMDGKVIYTPDTMPTGDSWIKFQLEALNDIFVYDGPPTAWDDGRYNSIQYLEYHLAEHRVAVTFKTFRRTYDLQKRLEDIKEKAGLLDPDGLTYWHLQFFNLDFDKILRSDNMQEELRSQLEEVVQRIGVFADELKKALSM